MSTTRDARAFLVHGTCRSAQTARKALHFRDTVFQVFEPQGAEESNKTANSANFYRTKSILLERNFLTNAILFTSGVPVIWATIPRGVLPISHIGMCAPKGYGF